MTKQYKVLSIQCSVQHDVLNHALTQKQEEKHSVPAG